MKNILPIIFIVTFMTFLVGLGHFVIYKSFIAIFDITVSRVLNIVRIFFILGSLSFIVMTILSNYEYNKVLSFMYEISAVWLGTVYFLFIASVLFLLICGVGYFFNIPTSIVKIIGMIFLSAGFSVSVYGITHTYQLRVTSYNVKINNLPDEWNNKKIVMFADSHFGNIRNVRFGKRLVSKINKENPDLVLIAGDYYDGPRINDSEVANVLKEVNSSVIFAPGNHEDYGNSMEFAKSLTDAGVLVLSNKTTIINGLQISGVDYATGSNKELLSSVIDNMNLSKEIPQILIKHAPNNLSIASEKGFDLVVSGHVHQGQVWPGPWIVKKIFKEFSYGLNYFDKTAVVTTSGAGTWGPPQRVGTNSEIVIINLEKNDSF